MIKRIKDRGFTLVELLAVIVVLAIILIIAVPRILNVVEDSDKEAFKITGEQLIKGAKDRQVFETIGPLEEKTYIIEDGAFVGDSIPMNGKLPDNGTIHISSDGITSMAISDGKWCAMKTGDSDNIIVSKDINCFLFITEVVPESCFSIENNMNELTITDYDNSCSKNPIIPSTIGGFPVISIGDDAFEYIQLTSVTIPNSVTSIGTDAFYGNQLTSVTIPNSVTDIGYYAFGFNQLTSVTIPNSVTIIERGLFYYNNLTSVTIPNSVTSIGEYAFYYNNLTSVTIPNSVTNIGGGVFKNNQLTSVILPNSLINIVYEAFSDNQLTSVAIPNSVTDIGDYAFAHNQLTNLSIPNSVTSIGDAAFNNNQLPDDRAFIYSRNPDGSENTSILVSYGGTRRDNVIIPNGVIDIGESAFAWNQLTSVTIPSSVIIIYDGAFSNNQLTNIILPNSETFIGENAFSYNQLTSVTISQVFEMSYDYAAQISDSFSYSYNILYLKETGTYTSLCQECDWTHSSLPLPVIPDTPVECFYYTTTSSSVTITGYDGSCSLYVKIPETIEGKPVEHIGDGALAQQSCEVFNSTENKMLAYNNNNVFEEEKDTSISSEKLLAYVSDCERIKKIILPNNLITIGNNAFSGSSFAQIAIPNSVTNIGSSAFDNYSIYVIQMPSNITIGDNMGYSNTFELLYDDYYSRAAGIYMRDGCGWINTSSALPYPENLCK